MSARLLRFDAIKFDAARFDAMVFRADSVRFEACPTFRGCDGEVCECGWLEAEHAAVVSRRQFAGRRPSRRIPAAARQAARTA